MKKKTKILIVSIVCFVVVAALGLLSYFLFFNRNPDDNNERVYTPEEQEFAEQFEKKDIVSADVEEKIYSGDLSIEALGISEIVSVENKIGDYLVVKAKTSESSTEIISLIKLQHNDGALSYDFVDITFSGTLNVQEVVGISDNYVVAQYESNGNDYFAIINIAIEDGNITPVLKESEIVHRFRDMSSTHIVFSRFVNGKFLPRVFYFSADSFNEIVIADDLIETLELNDTFLSLTTPYYTKIYRLGAENAVVLKVFSNRYGVANSATAHRIIENNYYAIIEEYEVSHIVGDYYLIDLQTTVPNYTNGSIVREYMDVDVYCQKTYQIFNAETINLSAFGANDDIYIVNDSGIENVGLLIKQVPVESKYSVDSGATMQYYNSSFTKIMEYNATYGKLTSFANDKFVTSVNKNAIQESFIMDIDGNVLLQSTAEYSLISKNIDSEFVVVRDKLSHYYGTINFTGNSNLDCKNNEILPLDEDGNTIVMRKEIVTGNEITNYSNNYYRVKLDKSEVKINNYCNEFDSWLAWGLGIYFTKENNAYSIWKYDGNKLYENVKQVGFTKDRNTIYLSFNFTDANGKENVKVLAFSSFIKNDNVNRMSWLLDYYYIVPTSNIVGYADSLRVENISYIETFSFRFNCYENSSVENSINGIKVKVVHGEGVYDARIVSRDWWINSCFISKLDANEGIVVEGNGSVVSPKQMVNLSVVVEYELVNVQIDIKKGNGEIIERFFEPSDEINIGACNEFVSSNSDVICVGFSNYFNENGAYYGIQNTYYPWGGTLTTECLWANVNYKKTNYVYSKDRTQCMGYEPTDNTFEYNSANNTFIARFDNTISIPNSTYMLTLDSVHINGVDISNINGEISFTPIGDAYSTALLNTSTNEIDVYYVRNIFSNTYTVSVADKDNFNDRSGAITGKVGVQYFELNTNALNETTFSTGDYGKDITIEINCKPGFAFEEVKYTTKPDAFESQFLQLSNTLISYPVYTYSSSNEKTSISFNITAVTTDIDIEIKLTYKQYEVTVNKQPKDFQSLYNIDDKLQGNSYVIIVHYMDNLFVKDTNQFLTENSIKAVEDETLTTINGMYHFRGWCYEEQVGDSVVWKSLDATQIEYDANNDSVFKYRFTSDITLYPIFENKIISIKTHDKPKVDGDEYQLTDSCFTGEKIVLSAENNVIMIKLQKYVRKALNISGTDYFYCCNQEDESVILRKSTDFMYEPTSVIFGINNDSCWNGTAIVSENGTITQTMNIISGVVNYYIARRAIKPEHIDPADNSPFRTINIYFWNNNTNKYQRYSSLTTIKTNTGKFQLPLESNFAYYDTRNLYFAGWVIGPTYTSTQTIDWVRNFYLDNPHFRYDYNNTKFNSDELNLYAVYMQNIFEVNDNGNVTNISKPPIEGVAITEENSVCSKILIQDIFAYEQAILEGKTKQEALDIARYEYWRPGIIATLAYVLTYNDLVLDVYVP